MAWVRVDDGITFHRKVVIAGNECTGAWLRMLAWSNKYLTDGHVIEEIATQIAKKPRVLNRLIEVGLLEKNGNGFQIHDFLKYQLSSSEIKDRKSRIADARARAGRVGAQKRWCQDGKQDGNDNGNDHGNLPQKAVKNLHGKNGKTMAPSPSPSPSLSPSPVVNETHSLSIASVCHPDVVDGAAEAEAELGYFSQIGSGVQRALDAEAFERVLVEVGAQPMGPRWTQVMRNLAPYSRDELRMALTKAKAEGKGKRIMPGLVLRIIERWRGEQPAVMMVPQPGTEWYESRKREDELLALERGRPPVRVEAHEDAEATSTTGAEQARAIINSLASKLSFTAK